MILAGTNQDTIWSISRLFNAERSATTPVDREPKGNRFLKPFKNKTTKELKTIVAENRLVPEAVEAARRLLEEKEGR